ncbi:hypothetical protein LCGC14_1857820 [marine sediment metagenome]|uniref:Uncharacterized protein n=1 Tax=marine sediment metagenome TaxID=412755 RepID=A0A0F9J7G1_9ZZZZ
MSDYNADPNPDTDRIRQVAFGFKLAPLPDLKIDQFSTLTSLKVYHCVKKIGSTRIQFLIDPDLIPHN